MVDAEDDLDLLMVDFHPLAHRAEQLPLTQPVSLPRPLVELRRTILQRPKELWQVRVQPTFAS